MSILLYVLPLGYYYPSDMISYFFSSNFHIFYYLFEVSSPFLESQTGINTKPPAGSLPTHLTTFRDT